MSVGFSERLVRLRSQIRLPRRTVRLRLTLLYGGLFLVAGVALLTITYVLVRASTGSSLFVKQHNGTVTISVGGGGGQVAFGPAPVGAPTQVPFPPPGASRVPSPQQLQALAAQQHAAELNQLLARSGVALGVMTLLSIGLGWLVAGRVLRPLQTMTAAAKTMSAANLHERLALHGPADELKDLGDTFDGLLERLEASFEAQRQFVANASHELRTPLARQRTVAEVALRDPRPTIESLRASHERVLAAGEQQERLIDALLILARGERGLERREPLDLAVIAGDVVRARGADTQDGGLTIQSALGAAPVSGDPHLLERLVANVVDNAIRHNVPGGSVEIVTGIKEERALLSVANTGPTVPSNEVERLFQPFRRLGTDRTGDGEGFGLGLSIVRAIATAHGADVAARARSGGGLEVDIEFPPPRTTGNAIAPAGIADLRRRWPR